MHYGIDAGLITSFPVRTEDGKQMGDRARTLPVNDFSRAKIDASVARTATEEKSLVAELIGNLNRSVALSRPLDKPLYRAPGRFAKVSPR